MFKPSFREDLSKKVDRIYLRVEFIWERLSETKEKKELEEICHLLQNIMEGDSLRDMYFLSADLVDRWNSLESRLQGSSIASRMEIRQVIMDLHTHLQDSLEAL